MCFSLVCGKGSECCFFLCASQIVLWGSQLWAAVMTQLIVSCKSIHLYNWLGSIALYLATNEISFGVSSASYICHSILKYLWSCCIILWLNACWDIHICLWTSSRGRKNAEQWLRFRQTCFLPSRNTHSGQETYILVTAATAVHVFVESRVCLELPCDRTLSQGVCWNLVLAESSLTPANRWRAVLFS